MQTTVIGTVVKSLFQKMTNSFKVFCIGNKKSLIEWQKNLYNFFSPPLQPIPVHKKQPANTAV